MSKGLTNGTSERGITGIDFGEFTTTSTSKPETVRVNHTLDVTPTKTFVIAQNASYPVSYDVLGVASLTQIIDSGSDKFVITGSNQLSGMSIGQSLVVSDKTITVPLCVGTYCWFAVA